MVDRINPIYREGIVYLEIKKDIVEIKGRLFNMKFNITKLFKEGIILEILQLKAAKLQFNQEKEKIVQPEESKATAKVIPDLLKGEYNVQTLDAI